MTRYPTLLRVPIYLAAAFLICTNPLVVEAGSGHIAALVLYFLLTRSLGGLMRYGDVRAYIATASCLGLALLTDARLLSPILALIPLLAFLAPPHIIKHSPLSFFLIILFPAAALTGGYFYVHAQFPTVPFGFMQLIIAHPNTSFPPLAFPWYIAAVAAFPLAILAPLILRGERLVSLPLQVAALAPFLAVALFPATDHPVALIALLAAPAAVAAMELIARRRALLVLALLTLGWFGGVAAFAAEPPFIALWRSF